VTETAQAPPADTTQPSAEAVAPAESTGEETSDVPPWVWLVLLLAVVAAIAAGVVLMQRRQRRQEWQNGLEAAAGEAEWVVQQVIPDLARIPTSQQRALTWGAASERVAALANRLAGLTATGPDPEAADRAQALGDAVRRANSRLDQLIVSGDETGLSDQLWAVARDLDTAVTWARTPASPLGTQ
jgi:hypothetical protein